MDLLIGTLFLILVLIIFTLFTYKAPNGMRAMGALANAAIATFLVEAFNKYVGGEVFGIKFLEELGDAAGGLGGVAAAGLTALAIGVSPVYALVIGAACGGMDLLPGFFAGYLIGYVMKYTEKYVPDGVDLIGSVVLLAPLARLIAAGLTPVVNNTLLKLVTLFKVVQTRINIYGDCSRRYHYSCWYCAIKFNGIDSFIGTNRYTYGNRGNGSI